MAIYVPVIMYGLRLFLQELHCLSNCLHAYSLVVKDFYRYAKFRLLILAGF